MAIRLSDLPPAARAQVAKQLPVNRAPILEAAAKAIIAVAGLSIDDQRKALALALRMHKTR